MSPGTFTLTQAVHFRRGRNGQKVIAEGALPEPAAAPPPGRIPRVARVMALAIRLEGLVRAGHVADYAEAARLGHVTRARVSQILMLLSLAPDIQEEILFLPRIERGRQPLGEKALRPIALVLEWKKQRAMWAELKRRAGL